MLNVEMPEAGTAARPRKLAPSRPVALAPLAWGVSALSADVLPLVQAADRALKMNTRKAQAERESALHEWLSQPGDDPLAALAAAQLLAVGEGHSAAEPATARLRQIVQRAVLTGDQLPFLSRLWLTAELPLRLALADEELRDEAALLAQGVAGLDRFVTQAIDEEGWPCEGGWNVLPAALASLLRCRQLLAALAPSALPALLTRQCDKLLQNCLRAATAEGVFDPSQPAAEQRAFLAAAVAQLASPETQRSAELAFSKRRATGDPPAATPASGASEAAEVAVLRTRWSSPADWVLIDHSQPTLRLEVAAGGKRLFSGTWGFSATVGGTSLASAAEDEPGWRHVCWHSDADCDYLELEYPLAGGWRLQRQAFLIRHDRALLLADALLGSAKQAASSSPPPRIRYQGRLPLASGVTFNPSPESREGGLSVKRSHAALVLPLAMPEWRTMLAGGELVQQGDQLLYTLDAGGRNLYAPLWIDLDPARSRKQRTWRRLTVGEQLQIAPRDVAAGFRVQVHKQQWLLYRSLGGWGNRTVLGKNFATDFACCRFLPNGETEDILEIE